MKKAMITIEVLITMLILFLAISSSFENIKFFTNLTNKKESYEDEYIAVLNIKAKYANTICKKIFKDDGTLNGIDYKISCKKEKELKNYVKGFEIDDPSGNIGNYIIRIFKVDLSLKRAKHIKKWSYYITRSEEVH